MWTNWNLVCLSAVLALAFAAGPACQAQDDADDAKTEKKKEKEKEKSLFDVPDTDDVDELLAFINEIRDNRPPRPRGPAEYRRFVKYMRQAPVAMKAAAERIIELEKDDDSPAVKQARMILLEDKVRAIAEADDDEREKIFEEVHAELKASGINKDNIGIAHGLASMLERSDPKLAGKAYLAFGKLVKASDDEEVAELASHFEGPGRRLALMGSKMEVLTGTTLAGDEFDWKSYRGKVVLVDFWATWCGPCVAELPNVIDAYEKYHDKGFDVVAISLDRSREPLEEFVEERELPWVQLYQEGGRNEMADYYGVSAIPTVILVDKDGTVVSMNARGRKLGQLLEDMLGDSDSEEGAEGE